MRRIFLFLLAIGTYAFAFADVDDTFTASTPDDEANPRVLLCGEADSAIEAGNYAEAIARLEDAIDVEPDAPDNALLLNNIAILYGMTGKPAEALAAVDRAITLAPNLRVARLTKGRLLISAGRDLEALPELERVLAADSINLEVRYLHGLISLQNGRLAEAEADFAVLKDEAPDALDTATALATLYTRTGRENDALPYIDRLIEQSPAPEYYALKSRCLLTLRKYNDASAAIGAGLEKYPDDPELYYCRAWLSKEQYRPDDTRRYVRRAIELGYPRQEAEKLLR